MNILRTSIVHLSWIFTTCVPLPGNAQMVITSGLDATALAVGIFQGPGMVISNATLNGSVSDTTISAGAYVSSGLTIIPESGILLTTGSIHDIPDTALGFASTQLNNGVSDEDLESIAGTFIPEATKLEFDFVPEQDLLLFEFAFGSEEYPFFVCDFNDAFGFFLSGPGILGNYSNGAQNLALLPDMSTEIAIGAVHGGYGNDPENSDCPSVNEQYYHDNSFGPYIAYNGLTVVLQASAIVDPGGSYHMKIVVGDASDWVYDSGVFLRENSFRSISSISTGLEGTRDHRVAISMNDEGVCELIGNGWITEAGIIDVQGRVVRTLPNGNLPLTVSLSDMPRGMYLFRGLVNGRPFTRKIIQP